MKYGIVSVNEVRSERGLPPAQWGNVPWLPQRWMPTDVARSQPGDKDPPAPSDKYGGEDHDPVADDQ